MSGAAANSIFSGALLARGTLFVGGLFRQLKMCMDCRVVRYLIGYIHSHTPTRTRARAWPSLETLAPRRPAATSGGPDGFRYEFTGLAGD